MPNAHLNVRYLFYFFCPLFSLYFNLLRIYFWLQSSLQIAILEAQNVRFFELRTLLLSI